MIFANVLDEDDIVDDKYGGKVGNLVAEQEFWRLCERLDRWLILGGKNNQADVIVGICGKTIS